MFSPERKPVVEVRPDEPEVPAHLQNEMQKVETAFTANVKDGSQPLISTPANQNVKIQLPSDVPTLIQWSKGSIVNAITWLANFWLRILKIKQNAS